MPLSVETTLNKVHCIVLYANGSRRTVEVLIIIFGWLKSQP